VAAFMELALYHPALGYYARAARRSGRAGDFFTSVDVGSLFGELLELQLCEMATLLRTAPAHPADAIDVVEAGAGNGRLAADILRAARQRDPRFFDSIRLHLVEASEAARAAQRATLDEVADRLVASTASLPDRFAGVLIANELLDALPAHQVVMREDGLHEIYVSSKSQDPSRKATLATGDLELGTVEGSPSTPELQAYLDRVGATLEPGWRAEINLAAVEWIRDAARRLTRGFIIVIDYGHDARDLYSASHSAGTLTSFAAHRSGGPESDATTPAWLQHPGERDITAHVDFTGVRAAAEAEGLTTIALLDQTYFLLGLIETFNQQSALSNQQLKTLVMPGGLGSTMKVLILGKGVGRPALAGCSFKVRLT